MWEVIFLVRKALTFFSHKTLLVVLCKSILWIVGSTAKPSLKELVLLEVATDWYSLGLQLGLPEHVLNVIEQDNGNDCKTCTRKMFSKWLSTNKTADYKGLIEGLVAINKKDIAENVSQKYCK